MHRDTGGIVFLSYMIWWLWICAAKIRTIVMRFNYGLNYQIILYGIVSLFLSFGTVGTSQS